MGIKMPNAVSHAPRPVIPVFPFKINNPVIAKSNKDTAYTSETIVHHLRGL